MMNNAAQQDPAFARLPPEGPAIPKAKMGLMQPDGPGPQDVSNPSEKPLVVEISGARFEPPAKSPSLQTPVASPSQPDPAPAAEQPPPKPTVAQQLNNDHAEFEKELSLGKITPQTYSSLFASKDTLGKIGSLFGLLVSGAGSGLAHQPNAVMEMMNKEIANDLDAQKASNSNAQNWYNLTQKHEMQKAEIAHLAAQDLLIKGQAGAIPSQIEKTKAETGLTNAQTGMVPSQIEKMRAESGLTKAQTKLVPAQIKKLGAETSAQQIETAIKNQTLTANRMTSAAWQHLVDLTNKLPDGAQKERAKQTLGMMYPQYQALITDKNAQAEGMINYAKMMSGLSDTSGGKAPTVDYGKMNQLQKMGEQKIPGGMSPSNVENATKEAAEVENVRAMKKSFLQSFDALDKMRMAGQLSPHQKKAYINVLAATMSRQSAGRYSAPEAEALIGGMFPELGDWPQTRKIKRQKAIEYFDNEEAGTPTLNRFGLKASPGGENSAAPSSSKSEGNPGKSVNKTGNDFKLKEGATGVDKRNGKPVVYKNGKWMYKK